MKTFEFTEEQVRMLKDACLCVMALMLKGDEEEKVESVRYKTLFDYLNS
jgi:hypothetical protein